MQTRSRYWVALLATIALASGCADTSGPADEPDAGGVWSGSFTHPSYDGGALTLTLIDADGAISGSYGLTLSKRVGSRVSVEQSGGNVSGSFANGRMRLLLQRTQGEQWLLDGAVKSSRAEGDWSSAGSVRGSFSVAR